MKKNTKIAIGMAIITGVTNLLTYYNGKYDGMGEAYSNYLDMLENAIKEVDEAEQTKDE